MVQTPARQSLKDSHCTNASITHQTLSIRRHATQALGIRYTGTLRRARRTTTYAARNAHLSRSCRGAHTVCLATQLRASGRALANHA
eukprot:3930237-Alexandrium_andersonii.AAC.1